MPPSVQNRVKSYLHENNPVSLQDLCYLKVSHVGFDGKDHVGELVVHKSIQKQVKDIFAELYLACFPIEKVRLIEEYGADDIASMNDNNSSSFCSRLITASSEDFSLHSYGLAIDINPLQNPYINNDLILPKDSQVFLDRSLKRKGMITLGDPCYQAFTKRGWLWGGHWKTLSQAHPEKKDYQHFSLPLSTLSSR